MCQNLNSFVLNSTGMAGKIMLNKPTFTISRNDGRISEHDSVLVMAQSSPFIQRHHSQPSLNEHNHPSPLRKYVSESNALRRSKDSNFGELLTSLWQTEMEKHNFKK